MDGFAVIAEPTRRRIVDVLRADDSDVSGLVTALGASQSLVSKHLKVLRDAGVVRSDIAGKRRVYRLSADPLPDVLSWVEPLRQLWSRSFDALADALDADERTRRETGR